MKFTWRALIVTFKTPIFLCWSRRRSSKSSPDVQSFTAQKIVAHFNAYKSGSLDWNVYWWIIFFKKFWRDRNVPKISIFCQGRLFLGTSQVLSAVNIPAWIFTLALHFRRTFHVFRFTACIRKMLWHFLKSKFGIPNTAVISTSVTLRSNLSHIHTTYTRQIFDNLR